MRLNISVEIIDDENGSGLRLRNIQDPNGKTKVYLESFDQDGTISRKKLTQNKLDDIIYILETGELPLRFKDKLK